MKKVIGYSLLGAVVLACAGCHTVVFAPNMEVTGVKNRSQETKAMAVAVAAKENGTNAPSINMTLSGSNGVNGGADVKVGVDTNLVKATTELGK